MVVTPNFHQSLPQKRMGAGCLFWDEHGRILLVKPTYKPVWEIPGGIVEQNESPKACCQREILEEIGLKRDIGRLLVLDYNSPSETKSESLMFIFEGGLLSETEITVIQLPEKELSEFAFFTPEALPTAMTETLRQRVSLAWHQHIHHRDVYFENQQPL